eukprot:gene2482-5435_t
MRADYLAEDVDSIDRNITSLALLQSTCMATLYRSLPWHHTSNVQAFLQAHGFLVPKSCLDTTTQRFKGSGRCMSKLEDQLKLLEAELKASASGQALARHQPTLIYNTLNLQAEALKSVSAKLDYLGIQMEKLSIREPSQSHALRSNFPLV